MDCDIKLKKINSLISELKKGAYKELKNHNHEKCMAYIEACADLLYQVNQKYTDDDLEDFCMQLSNELIGKSNQLYVSNSKNVLFYDGFGLDIRGLAVIYTKAIALSGYHLIYVTNKKSINCIPHIVKELSKYSADIEYISMDNYVSWIQELNDIFLKYKPKNAFLYTTPDDIPGSVVFFAYRGAVTRFQIDLTDHAFWIGAKCVDFTLNGRALGVSNAIYERGFKREQVLILDCPVYVNNDICDKKLPFDIGKERYFFTGGALYKTLGDNSLLYYKIVDYILSKHKDIKFLYAGFGDSNEIEKLKKKYPNRVFFIEERPDFFYLIKNCVFYLNSYPIFGGMMMRYAAIANKLPITLKHEQDSDNILINQNKLGIEFNTVEEIVEEIDKIITNNNYRHNKELNMKNAVLSEIDFAENIKLIMEKQQTNFSIELENRIDTSIFKAEYLNRISIDHVKMSSIAKRINRTLFFDYPFLFIKKVVISLSNLLK